MHEPPSGAVAAPSRRTEELLTRAALAVSAAGGERVLSDLVRQLAEILAVEVAFIALRKPGDPATLRMAAIWIDGAERPSIEYPLAGTPCETIVGRQYRAYASRLTEIFPLDTDFAALGLQSYAGYPLGDAHGEHLGLMSVAARRPITEPALFESIVKIFAVRATAELERLRAEQALRESEASYRAIFDACADAIFVHDWDTGGIVDVNPRACESYGYDRDEMVRMTVGELSAGVAPYTQADALRHIEAARRGERPVFEWHSRNRAGALHWTRSGSPR